MTPSAKPQTAAGRALLERIFADDFAGTLPALVSAQLRQAEKQAAAAAIERVRAALNITDETPYYFDRTVDEIRLALDAAAGEGPPQPGSAGGEEPWHFQTNAERYR